MERKNEERKMSTQLNYKPLPASLQISCSPIQGMGIFAKKDIEKGHNFGMSHLKIGERLIRTPLGGFINHSEIPNCYKTKLFYTDEDTPNIKMNYSVWNIIAVEDIKEGEELTVTYTFYKI